MLQRIHSVHIYVQNQSEAVHFYKDVLGFEIRRWEPLGPAGSWIEMAPPGSDSSLVLYPQDLMPDWQTRRAFVIFRVEDLESIYQELAARSVTFVREPTSLGWAELAVLADPYGNEIGLMQVTREPSRVPGASAPPGRSGGPPPPPPPRPRR
jgi:predicted enzyme related to lactoylglutathione lyase